LAKRNVVTDCGEKQNMSSLTPGQINALEMIMKIMNSSSLVCSLLVVITYLKFKRDFPRALAMYFSIGAFFLALFMVLIYPVGVNRVFASPILCAAQGFFITFFGSTCIWWFLFIALDVYLAVKLKKSTEEQKKYQLLFHIVTWGVSLIQAVIPLIASQYKPRGLWCWIYNASHGAWEFGCFYSVMFILAVVSLYLWIRVISTVLQLSRVSPSGSHSYLYRHVFFIFFFFGILVVMLFHRAYELIRENFVLLLLHTLTLSSVGVVAFLVFGISKDNILLWKAYIRGNKSSDYEVINT